MSETHSSPPTTEYFALANPHVKEAVLGKEYDTLYVPDSDPMQRGIGGYSVDPGTGEMSIAFTNDKKSVASKLLKGQQPYFSRDVIGGRMSFFGDPLPETDAGQQATHSAQAPTDGVSRGDSVRPDGKDDDRTVRGGDLGHTAGVREDDGSVKT
jgi:hypothetical protein